MTSHRTSRPADSRPARSPGGRLLTVEQAAEQLQVHPQTIYKLISRRRIESVRLGSRSRRVPQSALDAYVDTLRVPVRGCAATRP
jgi:excisionase family DNA binding protein